MVETVSRPTTGNKSRVQYRNGAGRKLRTGRLTAEQQAIAEERTMGNWVSEWNPASAFAWQSL